MTELWRTRRATRVRGWLLSAEVAARLCCRALVPVLAAGARRHGRRGSVRTTIEVAATPRCHRSD